MNVNKTNSLKKKIKNYFIKKGIKNLIKSFLKKIKKIVRF